MKKIFLPFFVTSLVSALLIFSCNVGLGESVDVKAPSISISSPVPKALIRDNFVISGIWDDDMGLSSISVVLENTITKVSYPVSDGITVGYTATFSSDKTWLCEIPVLDEDGQKLIPDGSYVITATAKDNANVPHLTSTTQVISIDNTAPVLVIASPASTDIENPSTYGKIFSIQGNYSDDSGIDSILVTILDEDGNEIEGAEKSLKIKGTTIDDTIALWEGSDGLYEKIYGTDSDLGTKKFYSKITIYDSARKVPAVEEDKGNSTSVFLMQNEVEEFFSETTEQFKTTELYSMVAGTSTSEDFSEDKAAAYENLLRKIEESSDDENGIKKTRTAFSLNPVNNPTFTVAGYSSFEPDEENHPTELDSYGEDGISGLYEFKDKATLSATITPGRDGYLIRKNSLELSLIECNASGIALKNSDNNYKNQIKLPAEKIIITEAGTSYSIQAQLKETDYEGLKVGNYYIIKVDGSDTKNNPIENGAQIYAIKFSPANTTPPVIKLIEPGEMSLSIKNNSEVNFSGTIEYYQDELNMAVYLGDPDEGGELLLEKDDFTIGQNISTGNKIKRNFSFVLPESIISEIEDSTFAIYVYGELVAAQQKGTSFVQITNDRLAPVFAEEYTITPTVEIQNGDTSVSYVNGSISIEASVSDDITLKPSVYYSIDGSSDWESLGNTTKISIPEIDTTKLEDGVSHYITLKAVDGVGNEAIKTIPLNVKQATDAPSISISNADSSIKVLDSIINSQSNIFGTLSNTNLNAYITDDDGIDSVKVLWQKGQSWKEGETTSEKVYSANGKTTFTLTHKLPSEEGAYLIKIIVTDSKQERTGFNTTNLDPFLIGIDDGSPKVNVSIENGIYLPAASTYSLRGSVDDSKANVKIYSNEACTELLGSARVNSNTWVYELATGQEARSIYIQAADEFGRKSMAEFSYQVDTKAPTFTITSVNNENDSALTKNSRRVQKYGTLTNYFTIKGTLKDDENGSGLEGKMYYKVSTLNDATSQESYDLTSGGWQSVAIKQSSSGYTWEIPVDFSSSKYVAAEGDEAAHFDSFADGDSVFLYFATKDNSGNVSKIEENPSAKLEVVIDGNAPEFKAAPEFEVGENCSFTVIAKDNETSISTIRLYINENEIEGVECNVSVGIEENYGWKIYDYTISSTSLLVGQNRIYVKAKDHAGNTRDSSSVEIDNNAPVFSNQESGISEEAYKAAYGIVSNRKDYYYTKDVFTNSGNVSISGNNNSFASLTYKDTYVSVSGESESISVLKDTSTVEVAENGDFTVTYPAAASE
ncbi:MAG: hypothetical protein K5829_15810, partial [Treponema sp.]|nr:hypothetical protein [Treponema sp.]